MRDSLAIQQVHDSLWIGSNVGRGDDEAGASREAVADLQDGGIEVDRGELQPAIAGSGWRHLVLREGGTAEAPTVVVALIVENAGFGSAAAAPIARRVFDYLLLGQYPSEEDIAATRAGRSAAPIGQPRRIDEVALPGAEP